MHKKDRYKLLFLSVWWLGLNIYVWVVKQTPFDLSRAAYSAAALVVILLLGWLWHKNYLRDQKQERRSEDKFPSALDQED